MANIVKITLEVDDKGTVKVKQFGDESKKAFDQMQAGPKAAQGALASLTGGWVAITAKVAIATAAFYAAKRMIYDTGRQIASATNDIERNASVLGMSIAEYQKWTYAAKMADVSNESLKTGWKFLSRNIEDANRGIGEAKQYLDALGIKGKTTGEVFLEIADRFKAAGNSSTEAGKKIDYAMALAGRGGMDLIPIWNLGSKAIRDYMDEAVKLGTVLGDVFVKKGSEAENTFKKIEAQVNATKLSLAPAALEFAKAIGWIVDDLAKLFKQEPPLWLKIMWGLTPVGQTGVAKGWLRDLDERIGLTEYLIAQEKKLGIQKETPYKRITDPKDTTIGKIKPLPAIAEKAKEDPWNALIQKAAEYGRAMSDVENVTLGFDLALSSTAITLEQYKEKMKFAKDEEAFWNDITQEAIKLSGELGSYDLSTSVYGTSLEGISGIWKTNFDESKKYWDEQISEALKASEGLSSYDEALSVLGTNTAGYWKIQGDIFKKEVTGWETITKSFAQDLSSAWSSNMVNIVRGTESMSQKIKSFFQSIGDVFLSTVSKMITQWLIFGSVTGKKESGGGWLSGGLWSGLLGSILKFKEGGQLPGQFIPIQAFQGGGYVDRPTLGLIGEGGEREWIVPESKMGRRPEGEGNTTIIMYIEATDVDSFERRYGGSVTKIVHRNKKSAGMRN